MYNVHGNGLGEAPPTAEPSLWDNVSSILTKGVSAGFNIYNKVQNLTQQKKAAAEAQTQAQQLAQYSAMYGRPQPGQVMVSGQLAPMYQTQYSQSSDFFSGWTMPLLIAGAAIVGVVLFKRK